MHNISANRDYQRYDDDMFFDCYFNGTSAAAPVVAGLIALYAQRNPTATPTEAKNWVTGVTTSTALSESGSKVLGNDLFFDQHPDIDTATFWSGQFNQRTADGNGNVNVTFIDVNSGISTELAGINEPSVLSPVNNATGVNTEGLLLRSSAYTAIGGTTVSGTLKAVEFQLSKDVDFSYIDFQSTANNVGLSQTTTGTLAGFTTYYARVRHVSNADGTAFTQYYSNYSAGIVSFATLGNAPGVQTPFITGPVNASTVGQRFGIVLTSSTVSYTHLRAHET